MLFLQLRRAAIKKQRAKDSYLEAAYVGPSTIDYEKIYLPGSGSKQSSVERQWERKEEALERMKSAADEYDRSLKLVKERLTWIREQDPKLANIIINRLYREYSWEKIAEASGLSVGAAKMRMKRYLDKEEQEPLIG